MFSQTMYEDKFSYSYRTSSQERAALKKHAAAIKELSITDDKIAVSASASIKGGSYQGRPVVVKSFHKNDFNEFYTEAFITSQLQSSPYIVKIEGILEKDREIILKRYPRTLFQFLSDNKDTISEEQKLKWGMQIARGLAYIHEQGWIYQDLKTVNIFLDEFNNIVIADFGIATSQSLPIMPSGVNSFFKAPEVCVGEAKATTASDVYGFGTIIWQLINNNKQPFEDKSEMAVMLLKMNNQHERIPDNCPPFFKEIIQSCWQEPGKRPTAKALAEQFSAELAKYSDKKAEMSTDKVTVNTDKIQEILPTAQLQTQPQPILEEKKSSEINVTQTVGTLFKPLTQPQIFLITETFLSLAELKKLSLKEARALTSNVLTVRGSSLKEIQEKIKEWKIDTTDSERDRLCFIEVSDPTIPNDKIKAKDIIKVYPYARDYIDQSELPMEELEDECNNGFTILEPKNLNNTPK